jgi:cytochrome c-type biogenesis protein CcmH/NrfG
VAPSAAPTIKVAAPGSSMWDRVKDSIGSAQSAIASPLQSAGRSSAKALGASDETASTVGSAMPVVLVVVVVIVCYIAYKGGKFFGKQSIKL